MTKYLSKEGLNLTASDSELTIKSFIEKTLETALESSQTVIERDYHVSSL